MTKQGKSGQHESAGAAWAPKVHSSHFARTQGARRRRVPIKPLVMRAFVFLVMAGAYLVGAVSRADAQTTYFYRGNGFNLFSCGPYGTNGGLLCSNPPAGDTTYTSSDYVFANLSVSEPLTPNLSYYQIYWSGATTGNAPGFLLTMQDGQQTLSSANSGMSVVAQVTTDANGNIISPWNVTMCVISTNACISTVNDPGGPNGVGDSGGFGSNTTIPGGDGADNLTSPGAWYQGRAGTATWSYLAGEVYGIPFTPIELVTGGDGVPDSTQWDIYGGAGWTYGHGQVNSSGSTYLSAGAYADTAGPCTPSPAGDTCNIATGAGRGIAYYTFVNTQSAITVQLNSVLEGELINDSGGFAFAAVYLVDAGVFANTVPGGAGAAQFLLGNTSISDFQGPSLPSSLPIGIPAADILASATNTEQVSGNSDISVPVVTSQYTIGAGESVTVIFDVAAYAPPGVIGGGPATVNFADTLAPASVMFTDKNGNPVTQFLALAPPLSTPPTLGALALSTSTASAPVGTPATVTVTATDTNGNALPNATVFFSILSGPDSPNGGPAFTNASGQASFTYSGVGTGGTDVIQASAGSVSSSTASVTWTTPGPLATISLSPANATIPSGSETYTATGYDAFGNSLGNLTSNVTFNISSGNCSANVCTPSGTGTFTVTATATNSLGATITGTTQLTVGTTTTALTITASNTTMVYGSTPPTPTAEYTYGSVTLSATAPAGLTAPACVTSATSTTPVGTDSDANTCSGASGSNYAISYVAGNATVSQATASITLGNLTQTYTGSPLSVTATTSPTGLTVNITYNGSSTAPTAAGSYSVAASIATGGNYTGSATGTLLINQATASITLGNLNQTYNGSPLSVAATTTPAGLTVNITYNGSSIAPTAAGSYSVAASIATGGNYTGSATGTLVIKQASQSITFGSIPAQSVGNTVSLSASSTSGLAVSFSSTTPTVCSVSGAAALMLAAGTCTIQAAQAGNGNYTPATPVSVSFTVTAGATFKLVAQPNTETIKRGILAAFLLEAQSVDGFSGNVKITCAGGPSNSVCGEFPQTLNLQPNKTAVAISGILFPANTTPGTYTLTFTGTSGSDVVSTNAQFTVED